MACTMLDSAFLKGNFTTPIMRKLFDDERLVQNWLDIEVALAQTQAKYGLIPQEAADEIAAKANVKNLDFKEIEEMTIQIGHPLVPVIRCFQKVCSNNYGEYIHLGATTQDIIDTGYMLSIKEALDIIYDDLKSCEVAAAKLAERYANTVEAGRTHGQQAIPITFGFKAAMWASEIRRNLERIEDMKKRCLCGQMSGAVGNLAGFDYTFAERISQETLEKVGLDSPDIAWHACRDRIAEIVSVLGITACTLGRIGNEVYNLQKTEFSELAEGFKAGSVGSSTMPHKRNPRAPEALHNLGRLVKASMATTFESMFSQHERDGALWRIEWKTLSETVIMTGAACSKAKIMLENLQVNEQEMKDNLYKLKGLMMSENVMLILGKRIGKQTAHEIVYQVSMRAFENRSDFGEELFNNPVVKANMTKQEIDDALDPKQYTGHSAFLAHKIAGEILT